MNVQLTALFGPILATLALCASPVAAHEYYLMPEKFAVSKGEPVAIRHRLGQRFNGPEQPWIGRWSVRSEAGTGGSMQPVAGTDGDRPALTVETARSGLFTAIYQSVPSSLTFTSWEKFVAYTDKEGLNVQAAHLERGLPKQGFVEAYARFAKTLVAVGDGAGKDRAHGLKIEIIAEANPYALPIDQPLPVQVLWDGEPLEGVTVKVFNGVDTEYSGRYVTDAEGRTAIPAGGPGPYLLNAIHMIEPISDTEKAKAAQWESFWASLTFQRGR